MTIRTFKELTLSKPVRESIEEMGFALPTDIQAEAIPSILEGRDVIGQAQTGTGKTAAFGIPIVERIDVEKRGTQAIILVPTRELAEQVAEELAAIGKFKNVETVPIYGGAGFAPQIQAFRDGVPIVVGTPGRIMDHMRRGNLRLEDVACFVLDEADRMLDMGFFEDIQWVMKRVPAGAQKLLFSATMPVEIMNLAREIMRNPMTIMVSEDKLTVEGTEQIYYNVGYRNKVWALYRVLEAEKPSLAFVFCRTKMEVDKVDRLLHSHGFACEALHGDMTQKARNNVMDNVRDGKTTIVIATDVLARGIDVSHCSHVINYDVPEDPEWYVHRIGRTGRMGKTGKAITFITRDESKSLLDIEHVARGALKLEEVPDVQGGRKDKIKRVMDWKELADPIGMVTFRINKGAAEGFKKMAVFRAVNTRCGFQETTLGAVKVNPEHTTVEVPYQVAGRFYEVFQNGKLLAHKVESEVVQSVS